MLHQTASGVIVVMATFCLLPQPAQSDDGKSVSQWYRVTRKLWISSFAQRSGRGYCLRLIEKRQRRCF